MSPPQLINFFVLNNLLSLQIDYYFNHASNKYAVLLNFKNCI